ncbi:DUF3576 domain-containing protein [Robiginitomaculum antarcticum]|uniref:DUF3576 domain-containing protein n=1 Tax=Robiginitomaculum antarcticum TaxID=437507 RepID=UPI0003684D64|nr:DUF3576 domain-containing protein [Robiginitomaculum antarcticum]
MRSHLTKFAVLGLTTVLLAGCANNGLLSKNPFKRNKVEATQRNMPAPKIGVNSYLWRASLETLNFMPMSDIDPFGGVILTEWYSNPEAPQERLKVNVYILDTQLRADALKVGVFKQVQGANGWQDAPVDADTGRTIENAILTRARELYIASN